MEKQNQIQQMRPNLYDYLKCFALLMMVIDHIGYYIFPQYLLLRLIGRWAFPIFLFLVGFNRSYRWRWNIFWWGIALWAITASLSFFLQLGNKGANILVVIVLARIIIWFLEKQKKIWLFLLVFGGLAISHFWLKGIMDYGALGFFFVVWGRCAKKWKHWRWWWFPLLIWLFIQNIQIFDFWVKNGDWMMSFFLWIGYLGILVSFFALQKDNPPLAWKLRWDMLIVWLSHSALMIYGVHIILLILIVLCKYIDIFSFWR